MIKLILGLALVFILWFSYQGSKINSIQEKTRGLTVLTGAGNQEGGSYYQKALSDVLPGEGFQTKIVWKNVVLKLIEFGVIDLEKFKSLYESRGGLSEEEMEILTKRTDFNLEINARNSNFMLNVLWALGLANKNPILEKSRMSDPGQLPNFASTGGWTLGREKNGAFYYNKYNIINLTEEQQKIVSDIAARAYRPCCDNPTDFPDCNHGAALLGLLELGASQGLTREELLKAAVEFNSFWFPQHYLETALYFKTQKGLEWVSVNPEQILSKQFSSFSGWKGNVDSVLRQIPGLLPQEKRNVSCGT